MIFADKLIRLRKKSGWSQEELAEKLDVSRQSVSKWEGAQSIPELDKIVRISELFGVSTDYLLKDDISEPDETEAHDEPSRRRVSIEEANAFMRARAEQAKRIAYATFLCIISPIGLIILGALSEEPSYNISETLAGSLGVIIMLLIVGVAVAIFLTCSHKLMDFRFLEHEPFETEYGVAGIVKERKAAYKRIYARNNILGTFLCIIAVCVFFVGVMIDEYNDVFLACMLCLMISIIAVGVLLFVRAGVAWGAFEILLHERESEEKESTLENAVSTSYWLLATVIYLTYSFATGHWHLSWIVWIIAAALSPAVTALVRALQNKKD